MGLQIERDRKAGTLKISQAKYIQKLADKFLISNARSMFTPVHSSKTRSG